MSRTLHVAWKSALSAGTMGALALSIGLFHPAFSDSSEPAEASAPKPIQRGFPIYPRFALDRGQSGAVSVQADIDNAGVIKNPRVLSETPPGDGFGNAALDALKRYVFPPGHPGLYTTTIMFKVDPAAAESGAPVVADVAHPKPAPMPTVYDPPSYPKRPYERNMTGYADLVLVVGPDGNVTDAYMQNGKTSDLMFGMAVAQATPFWNFRGIAAGAYEMRVDFNPDTLARGIVKLDTLHWSLTEPPRELGIPEGAKLPSYPAAAGVVRVHGMAQIMVRLDDGKPDNVEVAQESPGGLGFGVAAAAAVLQWQFDPKLRDGIYSIHLQFSPGP